MNLVAWDFVAQLLWLLVGGFELRMISNGSRSLRNDFDYITSNHRQTGVNVVDFKPQEVGLPDCVIIVKVQK